MGRQDFVTPKQLMLYNHGGHGKNRREKNTREKIKRAKNRREKKATEKREDDTQDDEGIKIKQAAHKVYYDTKYTLIQHWDPLAWERRELFPVKIVLGVVHKLCRAKNEVALSVYLNKLSFVVFGCWQDNKCTKVAGLLYPLRKSMGNDINRSNILRELWRGFLI